MNIKGAVLRINDNSVRTTNFSTLLLVIEVFGSPIMAPAQFLKQGSAWYLPYAGIDFRLEPPQVIPSKIHNLRSRPAAISDANGDLLFYTDGDTIWNNQHQVMLNGTQINVTSEFPPTTTVIVPHPGDEASEL